MNRLWFYYGKKENDSRGRGVHLHDFGNIGNEPIEKASNPVNIGIQKNLIYFSRVKARIIDM